MVQLCAAAHDQRHPPAPPRSDRALGALAGALFRERLTRLQVIGIAAIVLVALLSFTTTYTVRFTDAAVKTRFGKAGEGDVHTEPGFYRDDHRRLLDRVSEQAGAVLKNSMLFEQTQ